MIQRIVRQSFPQLRHCYERGLAANGNLKGRVRVKLTIAEDGSVGGASADSLTDLPDASVVACVVRGFTTLAFPRPDGGKVAVIYPILFSPEEDASASGTAKP